MNIFFHIYCFYYKLLLYLRIVLFCIEALDLHDKHFSRVGNYNKLSCCEVIYHGKAYFVLISLVYLNFVLQLKCVSVFSVSLYIISNYPYNKN